MAIKENKKRIQITLDRKDIEVLEEMQINKTKLAEMLIKEWIKANGR